jgi:hypothetical protein
VLSLLMTSLVSCRVTRQEVEATLWLNNSPIPAEVCRKEPDLWKYGFYRRLDSGKFEFVSFCKLEARKWIAIYEDDMNRLLDRLAEGNGKVQ